MQVEKYKINVEMKINKLSTRFSKLLRDTRLDKNYSASELSKKLNKKVQYISGLETQEHKTIPPGVIVKLEKILDLENQELFKAASFDGRIGVNKEPGKIQEEIFFPLEKESHNKPYRVKESTIDDKISSRLFHLYLKNTNIHHFEISKLIGMNKYYIYNLISRRGIKNKPSIRIPAHTIIAFEQILDIPKGLLLSAFIHDDRLAEHYLDERDEGMKEISEKVKILHNYIECQDSELKKLVRLPDINSVLPFVKSITREPLWS
jgi:transcriptional regulator with XRE-family HTH domain